MTSAMTDFIPPHAEPAEAHLPLWRFVPTFVRNPLLTLPRRVYEDRLVYRPGARSTVWVTAPDLVETLLLGEQAHVFKTQVERRALGPSLGAGLLTSEGSSWRWQRRTAAPLFRHGDLLALVPAMVDAADAQVEDWRSQPTAKAVGIERAMEETTFRIISTTIFAGAADGEGESIRQSGQRYLRHVPWELAAAILNLPPWAWHPGKTAMRQAAAQSRATVAKILERRRHTNGTGSDITSRLIRARDPETDTPMSDELLIDNLLTFLAAGHETTATALTWTLYLLARAPEWQERIATEVKDVAGSNRLDATHLSGLTITTQVIKEAMRLYPPAPVISRVSDRTIDLDGHRISAGTHIVIPIYAIHRHRVLWAQPNVFNPDRFRREREVDHARAQYMPFGLGPRICIGMSFAMIEATLLLATFVRSARFDWDGVHKPEPVSRITLRPRGGMPLFVSMR